MKLYVEEDGSALVRERVSEASVVATAAIAYVETRAALARRRRAGDLAAGEHRRVVSEFETDWDRYVRLDITDGLIHEAATLADRHHLRAYDAIHLATALIVRQRLGDEIVFACWDDELDAAAARERLDIVRRRGR